MDAETFALVAGGGPVGLTAAIELAWRSVPAMLVTDKLDTAQHPKCNSTNARSMEHFRRLGIADELRSEGLPSDIARASAYVTRFCGHEFGRLPRPYSDWQTPEIPNNVAQPVLERALRRCAERQPNSQIHFGWRLDSFAAHDDHVLAEIEDTQSGERRRIRARYLIGVDGASSTVRRALGFAMLGEDGTTHRAFMGGTMLSFYIRSPTLMAASGRAPTNMTWILNPDMRGMMYAQDGRETWVVHYQVPPGADWREVDGKAVIAAMIGADIPFEIISGGPWNWDSYTPLDRPGARAPHFWSAPGRAAYDEFGQGFTLLDFGAPEDAGSIEAAAKARGVPLKTLQLKPPDGLYRSNLVLIRPDQHIAWHGDRVPDAMAVIDRVRGA